MHHILVKLGYKPSPKTINKTGSPELCLGWSSRTFVFLAKLAWFFKHNFYITLPQNAAKKWFGVWVCVEISDASANRLSGHMEDTTKMDLGRQSGMDWPLVPKEKMVGIFCPVRPCCKFLWPFCSWSAGGKIEIGWRCWWSLFASVWNMFASEMTSYWDSTLHVHTVPHLVPVYCMTLQHQRCMTPSKVNGPE